MMDGLWKANIYAKSVHFQMLRSEPLHYLWENFSAKVCYSTRWNI